MKIAWHIDAMCYEIRVLSLTLFTLPLLVAVGFAGLTWFLQIGHVNQSFIRYVLIAALEACLPLTAGIIATTIATQDPAIELQLTVPLPYRTTTFCRLALILIWTALITLLATLIMQWALPWVLPRSFAQGQLIWIAPMLWFAALGALLALLMHNRSTSSAILGCLWVIQLAFHSYFIASNWTQPWFLFTTLYDPSASFWLTNRVELIATAIVLFGATWWYLHNPERRFFGEEA